MILGGHQLDQLTFHPVILFPKALAWGETAMQPDCQHERIRKRRGANAPYQLVLPTFVTAATAILCLSGTNSATAFIPASSVWGPRSAALRQTVRTVAPSSQISSVENKRHQVPRMVLGESATAACRRMLQRAWRASPAETSFNEMVRKEAKVFRLGDFRKYTAVFFLL